MIALLHFPGHKACYWTFTYFIFHHPYRVCTAGTILDDKSPAGSAMIPTQFFFRECQLKVVFLSPLPSERSSEVLTRPPVQAPGPWERQPGTLAFIRSPNVNWQMSLHLVFALFWALSSSLHMCRRKLITRNVTSAQTRNWLLWFLQVMGSLLKTKLIARKDSD